MGSRRSKFELALDLLNVIIDGETKPTRIMYKANLSWRSLNELLIPLVKNGLVEESVIESPKKSRKRYEITGKGRNVVNYYRNLTGLIEAEPINLET